MCNIDVAKRLRHFNSQEKMIECYEEQFREVLTPVIKILKNREREATTIKTHEDVGPFQRDLLPRGTFMDKNREIWKSKPQKSVRIDQTD